MYQVVYYSFFKIDVVLEVLFKIFMLQEWYKFCLVGIYFEVVDNFIVRKLELKLEGGFRCKKCVIDGVKSNLYNFI